MRSLAWARRVLSILLVLLLLPACAPASAQGVTTDNWREYVRPGDVPTGMYAITKCKDGKPIVHLAGLDTLAVLQIEELWSHERIHVDQLLRDKSLTCEQALQTMFGNPFTMVESEAEAYCSHAQWGMKNHPSLDPLVMLLHSANKVVDHYARTDSAWVSVRYDVAAVFIRMCPAAIRHGR